jgi:hypothetical protein
MQRTAEQVEQESGMSWIDILLRHRTVVICLPEPCQSWPNSIPENLQLQQVNATPQLSSRELQSPAQLMDRSQLLDKTGDQINGGYNSPLPGRGGPEGWAHLHWADLAHVVAEWHSCSLVKLATYLTTLEKLVVSWKVMSKKLSFSFPCEQKRLATAHKPALGGNPSENLPAPNSPSHQEKPGLQHPEPILPKQSKREGHIHWT